MRHFLFQFAIFKCAFTIRGGGRLLRFKSLLLIFITLIAVVLGYQNCGGGGLYVSLNHSGSADLFSQSFVQPFEPVSIFLHSGDKLFLMAAPNSGSDAATDSSVLQSAKSLAATQSESQSSVAYHWFLGDSEISVPGHFIVLQNVDSKMSGTYSVEFMQNGEKQRRKIAEVVVQEKTNLSEAPQIIEQPKILRQGNGKTVLFASALGSPQPSVRWYHDGQILEQENSSYLVLQNENPQGDFYAQFSNSASTVSTAHLTLSDTPVAPRIVNLRNVFSYIEGDVVRIFVEASGYPQPEIKIQKNGVDLVLTQKASLQFTNIRFADAGSYRVIASNKLGQDEQIVQINVACQSNFHVESNTCISNIKSCIRSDGSVGQKYWSGTGYGSCQQLVCEATAHYDTVAKTCVANERSCVAANGSGVNIWNGSAWGSACVARACFDGYHLEGNDCVANSRSCSVLNGVGSQLWDGTKYGECLNPVCNNDYHLEGYSCVYNYRECPVTNGVGLQTWNGITYPSCTVVSCKPGFEAHDNACYLACKSGEHFEGDQCRPNSRVCSVAFGSGSAVWTGEGYSSCVVSTCGTGYRVSNDAKSCTKICDAGFHSDDGVTCVSDVKVCYVDHGRGTQLWSGVAYGSCTVNDCDDLFTIKDNACRAVVCQPGQVWDRTAKACVAPYKQTYSSGHVDVGGGCVEAGFSVALSRSVSLTGVGYNYSLDWVMRADYTDGTGSMTFSSGEVRDASYSYGRDGQAIRVIAPVNMNDDVLVYANRCKGGEPDTLFLKIKNEDFR